MIPVFQTRYAVETFGNCVEACLASILELPLSAIPDRATLVDQDAWADRVTRALAAGDDVGDLDLPPEYEEGEKLLAAWLAARGLATLDVELDEQGLTEKAWLKLAADTLRRGYWIGHTRGIGDWAHASVWRADEPVHDPHRGREPSRKTLGELHRATVLIAGDPARLARVHEPLPDVAGALQAVA